MTELDVKWALTKYHSFRKLRNKLNDQLLTIETQQTKTGGSIIKMPDGNNSNEQRKLGLIVKKTVVEDDLSKCNYYIELGDDFIKAIKEPLRSMIKNKYVDRVSNVRLEQTYCYSRKGIDKIVNKLIERYIDET